MFCLLCQRGVDWLARDAFQRPESAPQGHTCNDARKQALLIAGLGATRVHHERGSEGTSVHRLAAEVLLALPGGPWWTIRARFARHLQAAMSSERIGAEVSLLKASKIPCVLSVLGVLGI